MDQVDNAYSTFTTPELERLAAYRAAVAAGFYTDWDGSTAVLDTALLAWLARTADGAVDAAAYPFTAEERQRLERARAAVASGQYSDELPRPVDTGATPEQQTR
jgi:hypothetical protein